MVQIKSLFLDEWAVVYLSEYLHIGCERHLITEWWNFSDERIAQMDSGALEWWKKYKGFIRQAIELSPAVPTGHEDAA